MVEINYTSPDWAYPNQDCADSNTATQHHTPNPLGLENGCRNEQVEDLRVEAPYPLSWRRFAQQKGRYESWNMEGHRSLALPVAMPSGTYAGKLITHIRRRSGSALIYQATDTSSGPRQWTVINKATDSQLEELRSGATTNGWVLHQRSGEKEVFDAQGNLRRKVSPQGQNHHYIYGLFGVKRLTEIRDDFGNRIEISYNPMLSRATTIPGYGSFASSGDMGDITASSLPAKISDGHRDVSYDWAQYWQLASQSSVGRLVGVEYPDGGIREYVYGESVEGNAINQHMITGVVDEEGNREATYKNAGPATGHFVAEWKGAGPDGIGALARINIDTVSITDQDGNKYNISNVPSYRLFNKPCPDCIGVEGKYLRKDSEGYLTQIDDWLGNKTTFTYDSAHRITQVIKAQGTPLAQTTTLTYEALPYNRDPLSITETVRNAAGAVHLRTTTFTYSELAATYPSSSPCSGAHGGVVVDCAPTRRLLTGIVVSVDDGSPSRAWQITYTPYGLRETLTDPTGKVTKWTWTAKGQVETITQGYGTPVAFTTTFGGHTNKGPSWRMDSNGLVTRWHRDINGRITREDVGTPSSPGNIGSIANDLFVPASGGSWRSTILTWRINNLLAQAILPSGQKMQFTYDGARRLTKVEARNTSNTLLWSKEYELSGAGSLLSETIKNGSGVVEYKNTMTYNSSRSVSSITDGELATTTLGYNLNEEPLSSTNALSHTNARALDQLGRPKTYTDALNKIAQLTYGPQDEVLTASDQRGVTTQYAYNGFGDLVSINSPDRGLWSFAYNSAGQNTTVTDPRGVVTTNTYDALNRLTTRVFDDAAATGSGRAPGVQTQLFGYDTCAADPVLVCSVTDTSGTTAFQYNVFGQPTQQQWSAGSGTPVSGAVLTTQYSYTSDGRLNAITYPSGKVVNITFGDDLLPQSLTYDAQNFMGSIEWNALGRVASWSWAQSTGWSGVHSAVTYTYDKTGRVSAIDDLDERQLIWDNGRRLVGVDDASDPAASQVYEYDPINRLTQADIGAWGGAQTYGYDFGSNRTSHMESTSGNGFQFAYDVSSNRLNAITPVLGSTPLSAQTQTYDASGNLINDGLGMDLSYDSEGRLARAQSGPFDVAMMYNAGGQRLIKHNSGSSPLIYAYDQWRRPLGVYEFNTTTSSWSVQEEYIHLDGWRVVGVVRLDATTGMSNPKLFPVLSDHLGTPRKVLDGSTGQTVWSWDAKEPFGHQAPDDNPSGLGVFKLNLRFPGQVFDEETGLFHNGFRDYHAKLGRYIQSDPLGLEAGWNTYGYVGGNPLDGVDPSGLDVCLESTNNQNVPFGLHQRVAVYDSSGKLVYGQSFGSRDPDATLSKSEAGSFGGGAHAYTGEVYNNTGDTTRDKKECTPTTDSQNTQIILPLLLSEMGQKGPYSATGIGGRSCRTYSNDTYHRLKKIIQSSGDKK